MYFGTDKVKRLRINNLYRTVKGPDLNLTIVIPYRKVKSSWSGEYLAKIECPFCTAFYGKKSIHYHGHGDSKIFGDGNGFRSPHCPRNVLIELELPGGTVIRNDTDYYIEENK